MEELKERGCVSIPTDEQETTISFSRVGDRVDIWTSDTTMITKLDKLCETAPELYQVNKVGKVNGSVVDKDYVITDKSMISFRSKKTTREYSEEEKEKMRERFRQNVLNNKS